MRILKSEIKGLYYLIQNNSNKFIENQFDFYSESLKKMTNILREIKEYTLYSNHKIDKNYSNILIINQMSLYEAVETKKDGNCFYSSISRLLFDTEDEYFLVKILCLFVMFEYKKEFESLLITESYGINFDSLIKEHIKENSWANQLLILALSILMNRGVNCYSIDDRTSLPNNRKYDVSESNKNPLVIGFYRNHFVPLLARSNDENATTIDENYYQFFKDNFKIIEYKETDI